MGFDMWNGNPNYESLPLPGTGKREGREYTKPFQQLSSRPFKQEERRQGVEFMGRTSYIN